jgi:hypothetical protein
MSDDVITLKLTKAEALVLFEWLARTAAAEALPIEDPSEQQVLWRVEGQLEKVLVEPLRPDYLKLVADARRQVREAG